MKKIITPEFTEQAEALVAAGRNKAQIARLLGTCQRTVRRALAALAQTGSAYCVYPIDPASLAEPKPRAARHVETSIMDAVRGLDTEAQEAARNREASTALMHALAREAGFALA